MQMSFAWGRSVARVLVFAVGSLTLTSCSEEETPTGLDETSCLVASLDTFYGLDVTMADGLAHVAASDDGIAVVDVADPASPRIVGTVETPDRAWGIAVSGSHAYLACGDDGLRVVDIADPAHPALVGHVPLPGSAFRVAAAGGYAYVVDYGDFHVVDVSSPAAPVVVASLGGTPGVAEDVVVEGGYAFVAALTDVLVIDVSTPASPAIVGADDSSSFFASGIALSGSYAYVADGGLRIFNISDPTAIHLVAAVGTPHLARDVAVLDNYAYVVEQFGNLYRFDVTAPAAPQPAGSVQMPSGAWALCAETDHLFVATPDGLAVVDIRCVE